MGKVRTTKRRSRREARAAAQRARSVWLGLLAAMTGVGALLLVVDGSPVPRVDGQSLPALVAAEQTGLRGDSSGLAPIFRTRTPIGKGRWSAIVIHHSGASSGSPSTLTAEHAAKHVLGLGHHFLIGNGAGMQDGELHVGYRWLDQLPGAHAAGKDADWYNRNAISICLIGDGNRRPFTTAQKERLRKLVGALCEQLGIDPSRVVLHSDVAPVSDPGRLFDGTLVAR